MNTLVAKIIVDTRLLGLACCVLPALANAQTPAPPEAAASAPAEAAASAPAEAAASAPAEAAATAPASAAPPEAAASAPAPAAIADPATGTEANRTVPTVAHAPPLSTPAGRPLVLTVVAHGDWHLETMAVRARSASGEWRDYPLRRLKADELEATLPAELVEAPGVSYLIASTDRDGRRHDHFASEADPHTVNVLGAGDEAVVQHRLAAWNGQRTRIAVRSELLSFGARQMDDPVTGSPVATDGGTDRFWTLEGELTYRPLRTIYDFRFGFGVMRGTVPEIDQTPTVSGADPGLNYGFGEINLQLYRYFQAGGRLILGASAQGFVAGPGVVFRVGDPEGTHLATRWETVADIGRRFDLRFHWTTLAHFPMALGVEFTDWPSDQGPSASVLSYELAWRSDEGLQVGARVGAANRSESLRTGFTAGLAVSRDF